jgi:hypothetical protein
MMQEELFMRGTPEKRLARIGKAGRLLQTRNYYGEAGVFVGTSNVVGGSVAVSI